MLVSRYWRTGALAALFATGVAACGESPMAPVQESPALTPASSEPLLARGNGGGRRNREYGTVTFTIRPGRAVLEKLGKHALYIPPDVTCDPRTSGYGPAYFDLPCDVAGRPIKVTAQWVTVEGGEQAIRFQPDLRFQPQVYRRDWVMLWAKAPEDIAPQSTFAIFWRDPATGQWIDESASDPTLLAHVDWSGRVVSRRLKHFSEYLMWFGLGSYNVTSGMGGDLWGGW